MTAKLSDVSLATSTISLVSVYQSRQAVGFLYELLKERTPEQSISHKHLPTFQEHAAFVYRKPYQAWYLIQVGEHPVGAIYLTQRREVGVFIRNGEQGKGYGLAAVRALIDRWPGKLLANISPRNGRSKRFFEKMGAKLIQETYEL